MQRLSKAPKTVSGTLHWYGGRAGHVARMERFWAGNLKGNDLLGDQGVDGRVVFKLILRKECVRL